jgi:hypothetical protein
MIYRGYVLDILAAKMVAGVQNATAGSNKCE